MATLENTYKDKNQKQTAKAVKPPRAPLTLDRRWQIGGGIVL